MKKFRVFREGFTYFPETIFYFSENITFKEIKENIESSLLDKKSYLGVYNFDEKFLENFKKSYINGNVYYVMEKR